MEQEVVDNIIAFIKAKGITHAEFARRIEIEYNYLHRMLKNGKLNEKVIIRMARAFPDVDMNYILRENPVKQVVK